MTRLSAFHRSTDPKPHVSHSVAIKTAMAIRKESPKLADLIDELASSRHMLRETLKDAHRAITREMLPKDREALVSEIRDVLFQLDCADAKEIGLRLPDDEQDSDEEAA